MGTTGDSGFDPEVWDELLQLFGRDGVAEMIDALRSDLPQQRQRLETALAAQDRGAIKQIAHGLRGVALQFGAEGLADHCAGIEQSLAGGAPLAGIAASAAHMLDRHDAMTKSLNEALRGV